MCKFVLEKDDDHQVRQAALAVLGEFGRHEKHETTEIIEALVPYLKDKSEHVRGTTIVELVTCVPAGDEATIKALKTATKDSSPNVRRDAAVGLASIATPGDLHTLGVLFDLLKDDSFLVKQVVPAGIAAVALHGDTGTADRLLVLLDDTDWSVRLGCVIALRLVAPHGYKPAIEAICKRMAVERHPAVRRRMIPTLEVLAEKGDEAVVHLLLKFADFLKTEIYSLTSLRPVAKDGDTRVIAASRSRFEDEDEDPDVQLFARYTIAKQGDTQIIQGLIDMLDDAEATHRECAARALKNISPDGDEEVIAALRDRTTRERDPDSKDALQEALQHLSDFHSHKAALAKRLSHRPNADQLVALGILKSGTGKEASSGVQATPKMQAMKDALAKSMLSDLLEKKMTRRAGRDELEERNILKKGGAVGAAAEHLAKEMTADKLTTKLKARPNKKELKERHILKRGESELSLGNKGSSSSGAPAVPTPPVGAGKSSGSGRKKGGGGSNRSSPTKRSGSSGRGRKGEGKLVTATQASRGRSKSPVPPSKVARSKVLGMTKMFE